MNVIKETNMKEITIDGVDYILTPKSTNSTKELHSDWRLPTIQELITIVDFTKYNPACDLVDVISDKYWSSTTNAGNTDFAWNVYFGSGFSNYNSKYNSYYVRCIRDTSNGLEWSASSTEKMAWDEAIEYAKNLTASTYYKAYS